MSHDAPPSAPAGWYPLPNAESGERFWDGERWTGEARGMSFGSATQLPASGLTHAPQSNVEPSRAANPSTADLAPGRPPVATGRWQPLWWSIGVLGFVAFVAAAVLIASAYAGRPVTVPDVVGMSVEAAFDEIKKHGLAAEVGYASDPLPSGTVLRMTPEAGSTSKPGDVVLLRASSGPSSPNPSEPTSAERAACDYRRTMLEGMPENGSAAERSAHLYQMAQNLTRHGGAVHANPVLSNALLHLGEDFALASDSLDAGVDILSTFKVEITRWMDAARAACRDLGLQP